ncbi:MAG: hypothetical protein ABH950_04870, partial [Candidatus Altiarchaeota archaeon]
SRSPGKIKPTIRCLGICSLPNSAIYGTSFLASQLSPQHPAVGFCLTPRPFPVYSVRKKATSYQQLCWVSEETYST